MKRIEEEYFYKIKEAYEYNSASTNDWADNRVREILNHLKSGNPIEIYSEKEVTIVHTIDELKKWKQNKNLDFPLPSH